jgi:DNA topoisomerase I
MQCKLCKREAKEGQLCKYHGEAKVALRRSYLRWTEAYSGISWKEYLNRVKTIEGTGQWVKDVITLEEGGSEQ